MGVRFAMSKKQWKKIAPLLPGKKGDPGRTGYDNMLALEALIYMAREGCTWRALPDEFGHWGTIYRRFVRWQEQGVFELLFRHFLQRHGVDSLMVDGTIVHVHQDGTHSLMEQGRSTELRRTRRSATAEAAAPPRFWQRPMKTGIWSISCSYRANMGNPLTYRNSSEASKLATLSETGRMTRTKSLNYFNLVT